MNPGISRLQGPSGPRERDARIPPTCLARLVRTRGEDVDKGVRRRTCALQAHPPYNVDTRTERSRNPTRRSALTIITAGLLAECPCAQQRLRPASQKEDDQMKQDPSRFYNGQHRDLERERGAGPKAHPRQGGVSLANTRATRNVAAWRHSRTRRASRPRGDRE